MLKPGDKIRIVARWSRYEPYSYGDVLYVDNVYEDGVTVTGLEPKPTFIHKDEFEVI